MPPLDRTLPSFELTTGAGNRVTLDQLVRRGPAVLVLLGDAANDPTCEQMLRDLGGEAYAWGARLVVVSAGPSPIGSELATSGAATWTIDSDAAVFAALDLQRQRRFARGRLQSGVFVVDSQRIVRLAFVAEPAGTWIPAAVVIARLKRLGAYSAPVSEADPEPAETPAERAGSAVAEKEQLVRDVAGRLGLDTAAVTEIATASRFADLGMATVPDAIINKDGALTDEEWDLIRQHPLRSAEMLSSSRMLDGVREIVQASHEHLDGSGYPLGLSGERIPLGARVLLVVEAYMAMTQARTYRALLGMREALDELRDTAGTLYDPVVVEALEQAIGARGGSSSIAQAA
ncbi:MAG TPA: HD domain-containing phosphohydrolase [Thermoleophilia bacterium]|nr:HD domain-containing phosphohydrolase [Thermoleophilia bacterium]